MGNTGPIQGVTNKPFSWGGGRTGETSKEEKDSKQKPPLGEEAADILQRKLKLDIHFQVGGGGFTGDDQYKADEVNRAALETVPTIKAGFKLEVPILGKEGEVFAEKLANQNLELKFPVHLKNENFLLSDKNTVLLETGIGTNFIAKWPSVGALDSFFNYNFKYADRGYPNWQFFSGTNHIINSGLALKTDAKGYLPAFPIKAEVFFRGVRNWFSWDEKAHGSGFDGQESAFKVGGEVLVPFTSLDEFFLIPDITISGAGIAWATSNVPEEARPKNMTGGEIEVKFQLNNLTQYKPYVMVGYSDRNLEGHPAFSEFYGGAGVTTPEAGDYKVKMGRKSHITHFYGEMMPFYGQLTWSPSKEWKDGRLNNLSISIRYDQFEIDGTYHQISALVRVDDPLTTIGIMKKLPELEVEPKPVVETDELDKPEPVLVPTPGDRCADKGRPAKHDKPNGPCYKKAISICRDLNDKQFRGICENGVENKGWSVNYVDGEYGE